MKMSWFETLVVNSRLSDVFRDWSVQRVMSEVNDTMGRVLEIGCGKGTTTKCIAKKLVHANIISTDFDPEQIERAKKNVSNPRISFQQSDASALSFKNRTFAAVFAFLTFHHIPDWKKAVHETYRVLQPNGRLYVEELALKPFPRIKHLFMYAPSAFSKQEFTAELRNAGFSILKSGGGYKFWVIAVKD